MQDFGGEVRFLTVRIALYLAQYTLCGVLYGVDSVEDLGDFALQRQQGLDPEPGHQFDTFNHPNIQRIAREGVRFTEAFVTTPLCSPSRASFLTGQYAHKHGIIDNTARDAPSHQLVTFPRLLHDAGYETAFVGKWHMGLDDTARPGIDYWVSIKGQGTYLDPEINDNGTRKKVSGYVTDIFSGYALDFLKRKHDKPFLLYVSHKAVHPDLTQNADGSLSDPSAGKFIPAERHKHFYADANIPHRPNYGRAPEDKPALLRKIGDLPPLGPGTGTDDETIRNRLRMLASVDESVGQIFKVLADSRQLDNTLIIFTSDESYFYGEHGLSVERRLPYEESARIPLLMRFPKMNSTNIDRAIDRARKHARAACAEPGYGANAARTRRRAHSDHHERMFTCAVAEWQDRSVARCVPDRILFRHGLSSDAENGIPGCPDWTVEIHTLRGP